MQPAQTNHVNHDCTPLHLAAFAGDAAVVQVLLSDANINATLLNIMKAKQRDNFLKLTWNPILVMMKICFRILLICFQNVILKML